MSVFFSSFSSPGRRKYLNLIISLHRLKHNLYFIVVRLNTYTRYGISKRVIRATAMSTKIDISFLHTTYSLHVIECHNGIAVQKSLLFLSIFHASPSITNDESTQLFWSIEMLLKIKLIDT